MSKRGVTPERVFRYASRFALRSEKDGHGTKWPDVARCAKAIKVTQAAIEQAVSDYQGPGYCGLSYWDTYEYRNGCVPIGKMLVEAYE